MKALGIPRSSKSRLGELALWTAAGVLTLSVHAGAAYYIMQETPEPLSDGAPPAAIMIELAALPEAVNTEETVESTDMEDAQEAESVVPNEVEPPPEPQPEPVIEEAQPEPAPEPEPVPEPPQEVTEPLPEEIPEPVEEIDPIQTQQMAALENVEVPLPVMRPPPPPVEKKVEKKEEPEKKVVRKPTPRQESTASAAKQTAKVETTRSDRTAASRNSAGLFSSSMTPAKWQDRVRSQINRRKPRSLSAGGVTVTVSFNVGENGALSSIRLLNSTGDSSIDQKVVAWIERASPVPEPPPGASRRLSVPIKIE